MKNYPENTLERPEGKQRLMISVAACFFALDFLREGLGLINPYIINILSLILGLMLLLLARKIVIRKKFFTVLVVIVFFSILALINGVTKGFVDGYTFSYTFFKIVELTIVFVLASNMTRTHFAQLCNKLATFFIFIHIPLFLYYLAAMAGIAPSVNRIVVFDSTRFAGLAGEPAQYGQMAFIVFIYLIFANKEKPVSHFRLKLFTVFIFACSSFSNAFFIPLIVLVGYYMVAGNKSSVTKKVIYILMGSTLVGSFFLINDRLDINFDQIWFVIQNFKALKDVSFEGVGINSITTRFFEVAYSTSLVNEYIGHGIGSAVNYPAFSGIREGIIGGDKVNFYGISQLGYELGIIPALIFIFWVSRSFVKFKGDLLYKSSIASILVAMFLINGLAFKLYWFTFITILLIKKYPTVKRSVPSWGRLPGSAAIATQATFR
ncbi:MAG: hypothetical protein ABIQ90_04690 [Polaromonas sp.]